MSNKNLKGKQIVISGVFEKYSRKEFKDIITKGGGKASSSISKNTSFILAGDKMGPSKKDKANELNIEMIGEMEFIKRFLDASETDEEIIKIRIEGEEFKMTKEKFFGLIKPTVEEEIDEDVWDFEACDGTFSVSVVDNEYYICSSFVDPTVEFLYLLNPKGKYVVLVHWFISNNEAFEVQFSNCQCTESLKEYYGEIEYGGKYFIKDVNNKLIKANSDYFQNIMKDFEDRNIDSDAQVYTISEWEKSFKKILNCSIIEH